MRHIKDMTQQETSGAPAARRTLTALGRTTALALLGIGLVCTSLFLVVWLAGHVVVLPIFILALVAGLFACILVVIMTGAMATIQNYRSGERRAPRWEGYALTSLIGVVAGMIIVASIVAANPQSGFDNTATS